MKKYTVKIPPTVEQGSYLTQADNENMKPQNHTRIIEWAERNVKEHVETIKFYQSEGMDLLKAYHITMQNTVIGEGYKAQVLVEVGITPAQYTAYLLNKGGK